MLGVESASKGAVFPCCWWTFSLGFSIQVNVKRGRNVGNVQVWHVNVGIHPSSLFCYVSLFFPHASTVNSFSFLSE